MASRVQSSLLALTCALPGTVWWREVADMPHWLWEHVSAYAQAKLAAKA